MSSEFNPHDWDDICFAMCMECETDADGVFLDPPEEIVAKYCKNFPHFADDLVDFAATCRTERRLALKFPAPPLTQEQLDGAVKRAMVIFRKALRNAKRRKAKAKAHA